MSQNQNQAQTPKNIWTKLHEIQKKHRTFAPSEDSEKKDSNGKSSYRYTPGWQITESIRQEMDTLGLMLLPDYTFKKIEPIEYPVYKMIGGTPMTFLKKELHVAIDASYTWLDTTTGETAGPFHITASGANGTDKSTASAMALAERYFLLKFFHITTHEPDDEPDAHDSDTIPGIPDSFKGAPAPFQSQPYQGYQQAPVQSYSPGAAPTPAVQGGYASQPQRTLPPQGGTQQVNVYTAPPQYLQGGPSIQSQPFTESNPYIREAVEHLSHFDRGTMTHRQELNRCIGNLSANGIVCTDKNFADNLAEAAQARRENRAPQYV